MLDESICKCMLFYCHVMRPKEKQADPKISPLIYFVVYFHMYLSFIYECLSSPASLCAFRHVGHLFRDVLHRIKRYLLRSKL